MEVEQEFNFKLSAYEVIMLSQLIAKVIKGSKQMGFVKDFTDKEFEFLEELHLLLSGEEPQQTQQVFIPAERGTAIGTDRIEI
jgi:hypothetical protein